MNFKRRKLCRQYFSMVQNWIKRRNMDYRAFVEEQIASIRNSVGDGLAINALSGGVDSSVVTVLGHRSLGNRFKTVFIDNALMRKGEPERVVQIFAKMK